MIKIVTDVVAARVQRDDPPGEHPLLLRRVSQERATTLLRKKLLEEVGEYFESGERAELHDVIRVCLALLGEDTAFSGCHVLVSHTESELTEEPAS